MRHATLSLFAALSLAPCALAQQRQSQPEMRMEIAGQAIEVAVDSVPQPFAALLLSASDRLGHMLTDLPPILIDAQVYAWGAVDKFGSITWTIPTGEAKAMMVHAQAIAFGEAFVASDVASIRLP